MYQHIVLMIQLIDAELARTDIVRGPEYTDALIVAKAALRSLRRFS